MWGWIAFSSALAVALFAGIYRWIVAPFLLDLQYASLRHQFTGPGEARFRPGGSIRRIVVIVNPAGGDGTARGFARDVLIPILNHHLAEVTVLETSNNLDDLELDQTKADLLVACCGDGTLAQLINSRHGLPQVPLAVLPCGSSNGLAMSLGSPNLRAGLASLLKGSAKWCDVLEAEYVDAKTGRSAKRLELHVCAVGIIADHDVIQEETLRGFGFGPLLRGVIAPIVVMTLARWQRWRLTFKVAQQAHTRLEGEGEASALPATDKGEIATADLDANSILLGGSPYGDSSGRMLPKERNDDGAWSVLVFLRDGAIGLIRTFMKVHSNGQHVKTNKVRRWAFEELTLHPLGARKYTMSMSGERVAVEGDAVFRVRKDAVRLFFDKARE